MRFLLALCLSAAAADGEEFLSASTQFDDGAVCFDLPANLASNLDLPANFPEPTAAQIEQHHFDSGGSARLPFEAPLPPAIAARRWLLLSTQGLQRLHPTRLRGHVIFRTKGRNPPTRTSDPPTVTARACTAAVRKKKSASDLRVAFNPANAAFAVESSLLWVWQPLKADGVSNTVTVNYSGTTYSLAAPPAGQTNGAARAIRIDRPNQRPLALIAWQGDATCVHRFSLHELGASGRAIDVATNCYDCDP